MVSAKASSNICTLPKSLTHTKDMNIVKLTSSRNSDIKRNLKSLKSLCIYQVEFKENAFLWRMLLVFNPKKKNGPFWFLPHDDENTAFTSAVYATKKYGGGFLAVESNGGRYFMGQDPNRNFGDNWRTAKTCRNQKYPAPKYSKNIFAIINNFRKSNMPFLNLFFCIPKHLKCFLNR